MPVLKAREKLGAGVNEMCCIARLSIGVRAAVCESRKVSIGVRAAVRKK